MHAKKQMANKRHSKSLDRVNTILFVTAPVKIEHPGPDVVGGDIASFPLVLGEEVIQWSCAASGSNIDSIVWHKEGVLVSENDFTTTPTDTSGMSYSYGQTSGKESTLTWKHSTSPTCEDITNLNGVYTCTAFGDAAAAPTSDESVKFDVSLQCEWLNLLHVVPSQ